MKSIKFAFAIILLLLTASLFTACIHTHSYGEWYTTKSATCTEDGEIVRFCDCGKYQAYVVGNLGHNYVNKICERCWMSLNYSYGLEYTSNGDGTCYVSGIGACTDTDIVIPTVSPNGEAVTGIGHWAFSDCNSLTSVVIPDSVTSIGYYAFYECSSLTSIEIPNSVTSIGEDAFCWCTSLTSVEIPDSVTSIGYYAFQYCTSLASIEVDVNNAVYKSIGGNLYTKDGKILVQYAEGKSNTSFVIPDSVTSIGEDAFRYCTPLTSVEIPDSVTSIGDNAFSYCHSLTSIEIPTSVTSIGERAFYNCSSLTSIEVDVNNAVYKSIDGNLYTKDGKKLLQYAIGKSNTSFVIPDSVTSIGYGAFSDCISLTSVEIPDSVTSIGEWAFDQCSSLEDVYYTGSKADWEKISIDRGNDELLNATIHYNYAP